ncbi:putative adhesin [Propioniciclava sinopodophylli]|uniref:putative adhesin n=1 Tax=Propioniciclava sinopodophylli TaxID=1837344 RepID=UPI003CD0DA11
MPAGGTPTAARCTSPGRVPAGVGRPPRPPTVDVYGPGDVIPEHVLYPPTPDLDIINNPVTVSTATSLADLITPNGGTYDWAACRNYPLLP